MIYVVVATDNVTLRAENADPDWLLQTAVILNQKLEDSKEAIATKLAELTIFGNMEMPLQ